MDKCGEIYQILKKEFKDLYELEKALYEKKKEDLKQKISAESEENEDEDEQTKKRGKAKVKTKKYQNEKNNAQIYN